LKKRAGIKDRSLVLALAASVILHASFTWTISESRDDESRLRVDAQKVNPENVAVQIKYYHTEKKLPTAPQVVHSKPAPSRPRAVGRERTSGSGAIGARGTLQDFMPSHTSVWGGQESQESTHARIAAQKFDAYQTIDAEIKSNTTPSLVSIAREILLRYQPSDALRVYLPAATGSVHLAMTAEGKWRFINVNGEEHLRAQLLESLKNMQDDPIIVEAFRQSGFDKIRVRVVIERYDAGKLKTTDYPFYVTDGKEVRLHFRSLHGDEQSPVWNMFMADNEKTVARVDLNILGPLAWFLQEKQRDREMIETEKELKRLRTLPGFVLPLRD